MTEFQIIRAIEDDMKSISEIYVENWKQTYGPLFPNSDIEKMTIQQGMQIWSDFFIIKHNTINIIKVNNKVAGFIAISPDKYVGNTIYVDSLHISKESRGLGLGTFLLEAVLKEAKSKIKNVTICIIKGNNGARNLYVKLGAEHYLNFEDNLNGITTHSEKLLWSLE
ncbi:GNAT family N-acetyltransferase [Staphylococcus xylosus]